MTDNEPDELSQMLEKITLRLRVGGFYFNRMGEIRQIVEFDDDDELGGYHYIDNLRFYYTEHGVYDLHDFFCGNDMYQLVVPVETGS